MHALRLELGDAAFFRLVRVWFRSHAGGNVAIPQFTALAERISGRDLDAFFHDVAVHAVQARRDRACGGADGAAVGRRGGAFAQGLAAAVSEAA